MNSVPVSQELCIHNVINSGQLRTHSRPPRCGKSLRWFKSATPVCVFTCLHDLRSPYLTRGSVDRDSSDT